MDNKENKIKGFSVEIGFYPGILLGARTYEEAEQTKVFQCVGNYSNN